MESNSYHEILLNNCYGILDEFALLKALSFQSRLSTGNSQQLSIYGSSKYLLTWDIEKNAYTDALFNFSRFFFTRHYLNKDSLFRVLRFHRIHGDNQALAYVISTQDS